MPTCSRHRCPHYAGFEGGALTTFCTTCCTGSRRHDLDLRAGLQTLHFEEDRMDCLDRIRAALCSNPMLAEAGEAACLGQASDKTEAHTVLTTGWEVRSDCTFLHLYHKALNINLDIQVQNSNCTAANFHCLHCRDHTMDLMGTTCVHYGLRQVRQRPTGSSGFIMVQAGNCCWCGLGVVCSPVPLMCSTCTPLNCVAHCNVSFARSCARSCNSPARVQQMHV